MPKQTIRITIDLPEELLWAVDQAVQEGKAQNRNELIAVALCHELAALERAEIDADFAGMA
jgi:metal-responsive CopG/Arc/MetJ family transcriptional regulator